jgi:hypothetical protein
MRVLLAAAVAAVALPAWAQAPAAAPAKEAPPAAAPAKEAPPAAAPAKEAAPAPAAATATTPPPPSEGRPYVDAALLFLKSFTHTNRSGDAGAEAWTALRTASADKVTIKIGGKDLVLDAAAGKTDAQLVRFSKLSTWRDGKDVKGVTLEEAEFRVGEAQQKGKAKVGMSEKDGKWVVTSIEVE